MSDAKILAYLQSHAPLDRFYLFAPSGDNGVLMQYFDSRGKPWNLMEDDEETVACAVEFLKRSGVLVFDDHAALLRHEQEGASQVAYEGTEHFQVPRDFLANPTCMLRKLMER